jgi:cyclopropane fatty-acyl-phospholipid synthase-like methyltransferase
MTDRKNHWEKVYRDKSPLDVSWYQQEPALSLRLIADTGIAQDAPIIDVGGGASLLVDRLCEQGFADIAVLDVSASALAHIKDRLSAEASEVQWYESDVTTFKPPKRFALWHDRAVFHFLTSREDRKRYVSVLEQALEPDGHLVIMTFAIDGPAKCSGLDIVQYDVEKMESVLGTGFELVEAGHETHITPTGNQQKFAWFRFTRAPGQV